MHITVLAVGSKMPDWVEKAVGEYTKRLPANARFHLREIKPEKRGAGVTSAQGMGAEEQRLTTAIPAGSFLVALDERGDAPDSVGLSVLLGKWAREGRNVCFIIGGADGIAPALKEKADMLLRLSNLTLPHGMVRVLLAEQLYRAHSILAGHPYHRE